MEQNRIKESLEKMKVSDFLVQCISSVKEAIQQIDKNAMGIVYIVQDGKLIGVVTDGDVRRFLLNDGDLNENVTVIMNRKPIILREDNEKEAYSLLEKYKIRSLPILNDKDEIIKIYFSNDKIEEKKDMLNIPVVIMAGGKGSRLYPYTQILPKPLIPIGEKTITEHIMERFMEHGCYKFIMIVNYKKNFIKSYFEDNEKKLDVSFEEEKEFWGTGGGLKLLDKKLDSTFFMTNCDILIEEDYSKILKYHRAHKNIVTMVCAEKKMQIPYGTVELSKENKVIGFKEKPEFSFITNTGFYVLEPEFLELIPENAFIHITDIIQQCIEQDRNVGVYKINEDNWLDMGQLEELERMKEKLNVK